MGKTTNGLEKVVKAYCNKTGEATSFLQEVRAYHDTILESLFPDSNAPVYGKVNNFFVEIDWVLEEEPRSFDFVYDQIVSIGELVSTTIVQILFG
jgi:aspartate kinase